ncbi:MAG: cytochrome c3 family protein [Rhodoferax sp.]
MTRNLKLVLAANLMALAILAFVYPHLMVGPGKLIVGHQKLQANCFACHTPFGGATAERCTTCHKPQDIGRLTTVGKAIVKPQTATPFHQRLVKQNCISCHSDHAGVKRFRQEGRFNHALLQADSRDQCQKCHRAPTDPLHLQINGNCGHCHSQSKWTPATFDHTQYFPLDGDHNAKCATCHVGNEYSRYTCYGCHEHTPENIRREHLEEGIRDFQNCVKCHRGGEDVAAERGRQGERGREKDD